jgi:hypothetical protein
MLGNFRVDQFAAVSLQPSERALFIGAHKPATSRDVGRQDGRQPSHDALSGHGAPLSKIGFRHNRPDISLRGRMVSRALSRHRRLVLPLSRRALEKKAPFKLREVWAIRLRLQLFRRARDLALFDLGIDSKLRACDLVGLKVRDICHGERVAARAIVMQQKTARPVQFEVTESIREVVAAWIKEAGLPGSRKSDSILLTTGHTRCAA